MAVQCAVEVFELVAFMSEFRSPSSLVDSLIFSAVLQPYFMRSGGSLFSSLIKGEMSGPTDILSLDVFLALRSLGDWF